MTPASTQSKCHAPRTAAEGYGEVTIKDEIAVAIERIPRIAV